MQLPDIYKGNYKILIIIPIILVLVSLFFFPQIKKGVDFRGGTLVTMQTSEGVDTAKLSQALASRGFTASSVKSLEIPSGYKVEIEIERDEKLTRAEEVKTLFFAKIDEVSKLESDVENTNRSADAIAKYSEARREVDAWADEIFAIAGKGEKASDHGNTNELKSSVADAYKGLLDENSGRLSAALEELVDSDSVSFNEVTASLSAKFFEKALMVVVYSAIVVSITVFLIFRTPVPVIAVLAGAAADLVIALGAMGLFGIPLTLASFAGLLMIVGFSLDTNVLLTMRVVKRKEGTPRERAYETMKTGTTMTVSLLVSFLCLFVLASVTHINTYYEISTVAIAGLLGDIAATWLLNAVIVLAYIERGGSTGEGQKPFLSSIFSG